MNRNLIAAYWLTCVLAMIGAFASGATTIVLPTDEQLVDKAPVIVSGIVLSSTPVSRDGAVWTATTVAVTRTLKGSVADTITVHEPGGVIGERITKVFGTPEFVEGETVLLFLHPSANGGYRTVDLFVGKFGERKALDGRRLWARDDSGAEVALLDAELRPLHGRNMQRDAGGFETFVYSRIAGRAVTKSYGVENPLLEGQLAGPATRGRVQSNFTLIAEPTVYRWLFANGQSAPWYHSGTQPGYASGGTGELQSAMNAWVSYSAALIRYNYAGALPVAARGLKAQNGYNEVLFNDPLDEIAGSWNGSGVVGQGGFNGTRGSGSFTATFRADDGHPAGTIGATAISEGNLTIQDNVSPSSGISSSRLAEILAHEFGHTLGFGHSVDSTALMYSMVTGRGASLREDDMVAARWLYPNGSGAPPAVQIPAPPTGLAVSVSGSSAELRWTDNANNESGQGVYLSAAGGAFVRVLEAGTNATTIRMGSLAPGSYRAYIVATNSAGSSAPSNTVAFTIAAAPVAAFTLSPGTGTAGVTNFTFTDQSTGSPTTRLWNFGDGQTSTSAVATHVYATSGQYTVALTVTSASGSASTAKSVLVSGPLNAQFTSTPSNPTTGDTIQFTDTSGGGPSAWQWAFGDGSTSTQQNPAKKYAGQGTYTVTLMVSRNGATASTSRTLNVSGSTPGTIGVSAAFDIASSVATPGQPVSFNDRSTGSPTQWTWSFGDGSVSSARNPVHAFAAPGTYSVMLTASRMGSSSSVTRQISITSVAAYRTLISAAAQTGGLGGTSWRTELSLFNAGLEGTTVTLALLPSRLQRTIYLAPRQSTTYANALLEIFGLSSGSGAVSIEAVSAGSSAQLRVTSRTFTTGPAGTYGQAVPEVQPSQLARTLYVTGIQSGAAYRTNIGLVNRGTTDATATLVLFSKTGSVVATRNVTIGANTFQQSALWSFFPEVQGQAHDVLTMRVVSNVEDAVSAYASVIDNTSQDPIYIQAVPAPEGDQLIVPVVGRSPGQNGTFWRSDVTLFNPATERMFVSLRFGAVTKTLALDGRDTAVLADILSLFNQASGGGALFVSWSGGIGPVVTSRTYTTVQAGGTYGQSIDPVAALQPAVFVPGLRNDASFRSNIGFVNGGDETESIAVIVLSPSGGELARTTVVLNPKMQVQYGVSALFPNVNASAFTLAVQGDPNARLFAYGSMVDNASGDPVFFAAQ